MLYRARYVLHNFDQFHEIEMLLIKIFKSFGLKVEIVFDSFLKK